MIRFVIGVLLIAVSMFLFVSVITGLEMEKMSAITSGLLMFKAPQGIDELNRDIFFTRILAWLSIAAGAVLLLSGLYAIYKRRKESLV